MPEQTVHHQEEKFIWYAIENDYAKNEYSFKSIQGLFLTSGC